MDVIRRISIRTWWAAGVAAVAVLSGGVTWLVSDQAERSTAVIVVVPPALSRSVTHQNPLLDLDTVAPLASVLATALTSPSVRDTLLARGATASYRISAISEDPLPLIALTATGASADQSRRTSTALVAEAHAELTAIQNQAEVPADARATLFAVVPPSRGRAVGEGPARSAAWVFAAVLVVGWAVALLLVRLTHRRRPRFDPPPSPIARGTDHRGPTGRRRWRNLDRTTRAPRSR